MESLEADESRIDPEDGDRVHEFIRAKLRELERARVGIEQSFREGEDIRETHGAERRGRGVSNTHERASAVDDGERLDRTGPRFNP